MLDNLALDVVTVTHIDRLAQGAIPRSLLGTVGRHRHQHQALDDCRLRRLGRRRARPYPHPHRRRPQPGAEARAAHGRETEIDGGAAGRSQAQGATLAELARSYHVGKSTISRL
jgi:hypothetical protein